MITDFKATEIMLIETLRVFYNFFSKYGYHVSSYSIGWREDDDCLEFTNIKLKRSVKIYFKYSFHIIIIKKGQFLYIEPLKKNKDFFDCLEIMSYFSKYKQIHDISNLNDFSEYLNNTLLFIESELMPIIKGEKWINKLFKSKDFSLNEKNHLENRISFYNQENINIGLNNFEVFLIECIRIFRKLFYDHRYYLRYYYSFSPNGFTIQYINDKLRMTIELNCSNTFDIKIIDNSRYWFYDKKKGKNQSFSLNEIKQYFTNFENLPSEIILSNSHDILSLYHHFIETELMPIIKGEMWIDELLKKKGYQQSNYELK